MLESQGSRTALGCQVGITVTIKQLGKLQKEGWKTRGEKVEAAETRETKPLSPSYIITQCVSLPCAIWSPRPLWSNAEKTLWSGFYFFFHLRHSELHKIKHLHQGVEVTRLLVGECRLDGWQLSGLSCPNDARWCLTSLEWSDCLFWTADLFPLSDKMEKEASKHRDGSSFLRPSSTTAAVFSFSDDSMDFERDGDGN